MSFFSYLTSEDDLDVYNILGSEYGYFHILSSQLINFLEHPVLSIIYFGFFILISVYTSTILLVSMYILGNHTELATEILHVTLIHCIATVSLLEFFVKRPALMSLHRRLAKIYEYQGIQKEVEEIYTAGSKKKKLIAKIWIICIVTYVFCVTVLDPIVRIYFRTDLQVPLQVNKNLIVVTWTPFDSSSGLGFFFGQIMIVMCVFVCGINSLFTFWVYVTITENFNTHCKILVLSLDKMHDRAVFLCGGNQSRLTYSQAYAVCLKQSAEHHVEILRLFDLLNAAGSTSMFIALLFAALIIACDGVAVTSGENNMFFLIKCWIFLVSDFCCLLILTVLGDKLARQNDKIRDALFTARNFDQAISVQKSLIIIMERTKKPMLLKPKDLVPVHMETFSNVVSASFSYYNILRTFKQ